MDISQVDPQLRDAVLATPRTDVGDDLARQISRVESRYSERAPRPSDVRVTNLIAGAARLRLYAPDRRSGAAMLVIHGGGMVVGAPQAADSFCFRLATRLGFTIASVDYRLAPEHPYPAQQDDCLGVWEWLLANAADLGVDRERIVVGGGSAGGGLAASVVNSVHDAGGVQPIAQWLLYPMLDDRTATRTDLDAIDHFIWNNLANRVAWTSLLAGTTAPGAADVPEAAAPARRADLVGLPNTWMAVGDIDLFYVENVAYADQLRAAGVPVNLDVVARAPHAFDGVAPDAPMVNDFVESYVAWLAAATATGT